MINYTDIYISNLHLISEQKQLKKFYSDTD